MSWSTNRCSSTTTWITKSSTGWRMDWALPCPVAPGESHRRDRGGRTKQRGVPIRWREYLGRGELHDPGSRGTRSLHRLHPERAQPPRDAAVELVRGGRRHDLHRRRGVAAVSARHRHRRLLQHCLEPQQEYSAPYHGITLGGGGNWSGHVSLYRFHVEDPVTFERSIRVTIEHGHDNKRSDDFSSVAYWYQVEPHRPFSILPVRERVPRQG